MKIFQTTIVILLLSTFTLSCSNDSDSEKLLSFENTTEKLIHANMTISNIEVPANGTILDLKKFVLEMNIEHTAQGDLSFTLIAPDGTKSSFIKRVGDNKNYVSTNKLRFSAAFTAAMPNENIDIPAGDYKESQGLDFPTPELLPIFSTLQGKSITGTWELIVIDEQEWVGNGAIKSWKLIFEPGALKQ